MYINNVLITPKIPWDQETSRLLFGQLVWRKIFFFQFFLLDKWTTYFTSFPETPRMSNSDSIWAHGEVLFKMGFKFICLVFSEELWHAAMWLNCPRVEGHGAKKKVVLPIESWFFTFFHPFSLFMVLHDVTFFVSTAI
jgi:hypothetical protein